MTPGWGLYVSKSRATRAKIDFKPSLLVDLALPLNPNSTVDFARTDLVPNYGLLPLQSDLLVHFLTCGAKSDMRSG